VFENLNKPAKGRPAYLPGFLIKSQVFPMPAIYNKTCIFVAACDEN
jgi:hypothetical protein